MQPEIWILINCAGGPLIYRTDDAESVQEAVTDGLCWAAAKGFSPQTVELLPQDYGTFVRETIFQTPYAFVRPDMLGPSIRYAGPSGYVDVRSMEL